ncbi:hypothetical protein GpartN1_g2281.t1 [Galdieria partita]|uniref:Uncharacterized protein n=1 Tax=Galdieria partita TaxID=83374 RepID=A0A9C7PU33_9RHOD|nr:hypothetical protein GpartN1_g2281.t1 [Galdieria partita]
MALEPSVEQVKNAALCVLQEAEQKMKALEAMVVSKQNQLDEAKEQLFRMRQVEIEVGQWKNRATTLERRLVELSEEREQLSERLKEMETLQKNCKLLPRSNKLKVMMPVWVQVLPLEYETKEINAGMTEMVSCPILSVCHYDCVSILDSQPTKGVCFNDVDKGMTCDAECRQLEKKRYSYSSITSESDSVTCLDSSYENGTHRNSEVDCFTSVSQTHNLQRLNVNSFNNKTSQTIDISLFYSLHSSLMIAVGTFILQQLERHISCWKGMNKLSMEDLSTLKGVVNNMLSSWDVSNLAKYELYNGKWISCFRNIWKQVVMQFDDRRKLIDNEQFLFFGIILFCCFFDSKVERFRETMACESQCLLNENLYEDSISDNSKPSHGMVISPNASRSETPLKYFSTIRQAMEAIIHLLVVANDRAVRKCRYWKKQAKYHEETALSLHVELSNWKARLSELNDRFLLWKDCFLELKERATLQQMKDELSKELDGYKSFLNHLGKVYQAYIGSYGYQERSTKQLEDKITKMNVDIEKLDHERRKWMEERNKNEAKIEQLLQQLQEWKTKVERLQDSVTKSENMRTQLERRIVEIKEQEVKVQLEHERLIERKESEISNAQKFISNLRIQLERSEQHLVQSRKRECLLETQVDTLQKALDSTKDELVLELVHTKIKLAQSYEEMERLQSRKRFIS